MSLVQRLPENALDIVGDIHGELTALLTLLVHLGYNAQGEHPDQRKLVFVGDLCDRGPDSYGVIQFVQHLVEQGNAHAILGNHEMNLLVDDIKDGSGWFFDERHERDQKNYAPFRRTPPEQRQALKKFLGGLPVALVRKDIRVVHAAWSNPAIEAVSSLPLGSVTEQFKIWDYLAQSTAQASGLYQRYLAEKQQWIKELEDEHSPPPFLHAIAEYEAAQQMVNPLKVLTSGVERMASSPFFAGNRWRFSDRVNWWDDYDELTPVVIGHYWRLFRSHQEENSPRYSQLFKSIPPAAWHGKHRNVFCVDFSVGARWRDRRANRSIDTSRFKLAALQWPENRLVFDSGEIVDTVKAD
ncbi:metallophosphoesterase [Paralcaligenes sp. KSB-10]|uniref:metallophosphoesterase n=1 Tax=Paralcaligenes sp. KSB-10 TaxID=2901142 RepID=UPI001E623D3C|nr:metallophosphoesterase [Paralcaligenes sp. KSB-10]UHL63556.1 metallophosphoesterase [Paralcaligenes sp. KSB-10]